MSFYSYWNSSRHFGLPTIWLLLFYPNPDMMYSVCVCIVSVLLSLLQVGCSTVSERVKEHIQPVRKSLSKMTFKGAEMLLAKLDEGREYRVWFLFCGNNLYLCSIYAVRKGNLEIEVKADIQDRHVQCWNWICFRLERCNSLFLMLCLFKEFNWFERWKCRGKKWYLVYHFE